MWSALLRVSTAAWGAHQAQVLSSFEAWGVMWIVRKSHSLTLSHIQTTSHDLLREECVISHHEVRLCEDPPELLGFQVFWVTGDSFQYLKEKLK